MMFGIAFIIYLTDFMFICLLEEIGYMKVNYKRDIIRNIIIAVLPIKFLYLFFVGIYRCGYSLGKKYKKLPSIKQEKRILKEKAQKQAGNLSIVKKDDKEGRLSVI